MSSFVLKIIACISMFCDHVGDAFIGKLTFLNYIGRLAFPIFCFQIVQGYIHTHDIKKYILRLSLFALISQIPFMLFYHIVFDSFAINVIFTLLFGLFTILIYDKYNKSVGACFCLLLGINNIIDAFEINLIVTTTAGKEQLIDFTIFDKSKAEMAEQEINKMISNRLDDTNNRQQTNRIVSAIQEK